VTTIFFNNFYFSKKEPCPCGSGNTYGKCCLGKIEKNINKQQKINDVRKTFTDKKKVINMCLYPGETKCKNKSIDAHALQNNRILSLLSEKDHVITLNIKKQGITVGNTKKDFDIIQEFELSSVKQTTTYRCFCKKHDNDLFAVIEKAGCDFDKNNSEQRFVYAYKCFIFEYYKELVVINSMQKLFKRYPSFIKQIPIIKAYRDSSLKINEMEYYKKIFDKGVLFKLYDDIKTEVIEINGFIGVANFACISPNFDIHGKRIKNIKNKRMRRIFVTIFPTNNKSYILLSYLGEDIEVYKNLIYQLKTEDIDIIKFYFNYMILLYSENVVIGPKLWDSFSDSEKEKITVLANAKGRQLIKFDIQFSRYMYQIHNQLTIIDYKKLHLNILKEL
jgi:hypothetical protein